jgi:phenylalanyl-tRNA synthetase beta chain
VQTTEKAIISKEKHLEDDGEVIYKIEVAANRSADFVFVNGIDVTRILGRYTGVWKPGENVCRHDLLCLEGLARALRVFTGTEASPVFQVSSIPRGSILQMHVKPEVRSSSLDSQCISNNFLEEKARFPSLGCRENCTAALFGVYVITCQCS